MFVVACKCSVFVHSTSKIYDRYVVTFLNAIKFALPEGLGFLFPLVEQETCTHLVQYLFFHSHTCTYSAAVSFSELELTNPILGWSLYEPG